MPQIYGKGLMTAVFLLLAACSDRGQLQIEHAWIGAVDAEGEMTGSLEVSNPTSQPAQIVAADSEAFESIRFYVKQDGQLQQTQILIIPARGHLHLDGDTGRLGFVGPKQSVQDGDHLPLVLAVRLADGQLLSLETSLHVHEDSDDEAHEHEHH